MVQRSNPPRVHGHGSAIILSPSAPGGVVGVWYCPPPPVGVMGVWYCPPPPCGVVVCVCVWGAGCVVRGGCSVCMIIYVTWWVW